MKKLVCSKFREAGYACDSKSLSVEFEWSRTLTELGGAMVVFDRRVCALCEKRIPRSDDWLRNECGLIEAMCNRFGMN
jgi:hypothetical protein